jgi:hypothetical protein
VINKSKNNIMLGGHTLLAGGASLRRDDVGVVSISQEGVPFDPSTMQFGSVAPPTPGDQFDRSLRSVWIDKNKVELVLRMNINAERGRGHHNDDEEDTITTAQVFARSVFDPQRLQEWKRLVEERLWKSISFCHRRAPNADIGLNTFPTELLDHITPAESTLDNVVDSAQEEHRRQQNQFQPITNGEEQTMWRGLMEPCRNHTQRLELKGELTEMQARVVSSLYGNHSGSTCRTTSLSACRLCVLCITDVDLTKQVANILGEIIHGKSGASCLKELSLSKCNVELSAWSALLVSTAPDDYDSTDAHEDEANILDISKPDFQERIGNDAITNITEKEDDWTPNGKVSCTSPASSRSLRSPSTLNALYLSDCRLRQADVEEILSSLLVHPLLRTLYMNGEQNFDASQVDALLIAHLKENTNIEHIQLPFRSHHNSQIQLYAELNRCGRRLLRARRGAGNGMGPPAPVGLWPLVIDRIQRVPGLTPTRRANARYYFVKAIHGISTTVGDGGIRPLNQLRETSP